MYTATLFRNLHRRPVWLGLALLWLTGAALANDRPFEQYGDTKVYYSVFNSSFIRPEVAAAYGITRGRDRGLVNISVVMDDLPAGRTAQVSGTATNLLSQQQSLDFMEIREGDSVYYLAPFRFDREDPLNFRIQVKTADQPTRTLNFSRKLHHDQ